MIVTRGDGKRDDLCHDVRPRSANVTVKFVLPSYRTIYYDIDCIFARLPTFCICIKRSFVRSSCSASRFEKRGAIISDYETLAGKGKRGRERTETNEKRRVG